MPVRRGFPRHPYSFLIEKLDDLIIAQDHTGAVRFSGYDASTVIQSAINALTSGGKIFIKAATYSVRSTIFLGFGDPDFGVVHVLEGEGPNTILKMAEGVAQPILQSKTFGVAKVNFYQQVRNIALDGNNVATRGINWCCWRGKIENVRIQNVAGDAIYICGNAADAWAGENEISSCHINNNSGAAIHVYSYADDEWIHDNTLTYNNDGIIYRQGCPLISFNHIYRNTRYGIFITPCSYGAIIGNHLERNMQGELRLSASGTSHIQYLNVLGNEFYGHDYPTPNAYPVVYLRGETGYAQNINLIGNLIVGDGSPNYGLLTHANSRNCIIEANQFVGTFGTAVLLEQGTNKIRRNIGFVTENSGTATFSGNGTQTQFTIAHGLAGTPKSYRVEAGSADAKGDKYVTADATNLTVTFATAPPSGTNNVVLVWQAEM
jgi:hypothetical protein